METICSKWTRRTRRACSLFCFRPTPTRSTPPWYTQGCTAIPLGSLCIHRDAPSHKPPINMPPSNFRPYPAKKISYKRQHVSTCVLTRCRVQSSGILVALWPTYVVLSRYVSSLVGRIFVDCPSRLPRNRFDRLLGGARVVFPHPGSSCFYEAWKQYSYRSTPRDCGVRSPLIVRMWTLVFGWPQLRLISPLRFL